MTQPTVSVLMPVYNAENFVQDAVDSILGQTFDDFELLILDDGSDDHSRDRLLECANKDHRVNLISRSNRGYVVALNEMIQLSKGKYLARMDADDISEPGRFAAQVSFLDNHTDHVLVGGWVELMNSAAAPIGQIHAPTSHDEIDQAHLHGNCSIWHPAAMFRREAVEKIGGYDNELMPAEDLDLWLRLAEVGKIANLPEIVLRYRLHSNSVSATKGAMQEGHARRACERAWERRGLTGITMNKSPWRAGTDRSSRHRFALQYGWTSWSNGHRATWFSYAREAIWLAPFKLSSWKLLIFGLKRNTDEINARR